MSELDSRVSKAVRILWIDRDYSKGKEAMQLLKEAEGDGVADACYFLARCYAGGGFVAPEFGFPEDDTKVRQYLDKSIENGSVIGMFAARRFGGYKPRCGSHIHAPYHSAKEVWDEMYKRASKDAFIYYLVANAYYYGDVLYLAFEDKAEEVTKEVLVASLKSWAETALEMYEHLIRHGMLLGVGNAINIITSGDYGVPKDERKAFEFMLLAADQGDAYYMWKAGTEFEKFNVDKAEEYYEAALRYNYPAAGYNIAKLYTYDGKRKRDLRKAMDYALNCLEAGKQIIGCSNLLGTIYFKGGDGIEPDYYRAVGYFNEAYARENYWASDMMGTCYLKGLGIEQDYAKAKQEFERYPGEPLAIIGLGIIYAYGLGVPADVDKAMEYWDKIPTHPEVIEHRKNFKKKLFGGWKCVK